jgi:PadR family transcriptional regulator, regulatory protein AphA
MAAMSLRHAMLGLLSRNPASGYDLLQVFDGSLAHVWPATQSQLYTELGRLTDAGLVTVAAGGPRGRKEYAITADGEAELRHWLLDVPPDPPRRNDALLRVFFLARLTPAEGVGYLRDRSRAAEAAREQLTALREEVAQDSGDLVDNGLLALEFGIRMMETTRDWAAWAADRVAERGA